MDATFVIPREYQNSIQIFLSDFHVNSNKDFMAVNPSLWMKFFVIFELIFQLPLFFIAVFDYIQNKKTGYSKFLWPAFLVYGFNAGFTSFICLIYIWSGSASAGLTTGEMLNLAALYTPTTVLPFVMMADYWIRISNILSSYRNAKKD